MDINMLIAWGASMRKVEKGQVIFREGEEARCYYQIDSGQVKMYNLNDEGKEFTLGIFEAGESFGEPPLFIGERYPASAIATKDTVVARLPKERLFHIMEEDRQVEKEMMGVLARRAYSRAVIARTIINHTPEQRILAFLGEYKRTHQDARPQQAQRMPIPYTRQDIANLTGLRVETVIRTLSALKDMKKVEIVDRKLYF